MIDFVLIFNSILLGIGLAMDAFSVSLANGLGNPKMKTPMMCIVAGTFALFQALMPLIGWFFVHTLVSAFSAFQPFIPWIALALLGYIGGKMVYEGIHGCEDGECKKLCFITLIIQGVATSIDALSVGFTISEYNFLQALISALIIAVVTFIICFIGILIGKKAGVHLADKAEIFGGAILIFIGLEIFITGII